VKFLTLQLSNELQERTRSAAPVGQQLAGSGQQATPFVLTVACAERRGIVHAVSSFLAMRGFDIAEHQQFDDHVSNTLFLRTAFTGTLAGSAGNRAGSAASTADSLSADFAEIAGEFGMSYSFHDDRPQRILVMVSKFGHCLNDLIFRWRAGSLGADIAAVVSNHEDLRPMAETAGLPFIHVPVTASTKPQAESRLLELVDEYDADLVVLARYMQVLSDGLCRELHGRAINIHHSFLPGFKGAKPYHQAYARGVKTVGATAHYVNAELDEGPIISQQTVEVDHTYGPEDLVAAGRDTECKALSNAVRWHCEGRVILQGNRTVVLR
jgi:formyltetrahydrofolate deformylase